MAMTQAQIDEFNRIRANQSDLAATNWADKQKIPASDYVVILQKYPVKKNPTATPPVTTPPAPKVVPFTVKPSTLPHPEEPMNPAATLANTNVNSVITRWFQDWGVPAQHWNYWRTVIAFHVHDNYPASLITMGISQDTPAATWEAGGQRHLAIKPQWLNPGVIAHEQAHNSYALLTPAQKAAFSAAYKPLINTDPYIRLLYTINRYGLTTEIEGHAEVYRYIGDRMPAQLKQFYPRLF